MSQFVTIGLLFALLFTVYWTIQLVTPWLSRRFFLQVALLLITGCLALWLAVLLLAEPDVFQASRVIAAAMLGLIAIYSLALGFGKLLLMPGSRVRRLGSLERSLAGFSSPSERPVLRTEDGVKIQAIHLRAAPQRGSVVIVCHGGGRTKDIYANVATCELLFQDFDILTFDFRGHGESGGRWTGDGATVYDLKAVIEYAREQGYGKVGVIGRSFGAWTAILEVARFHNADALVAAAPPPTDMREVEISKILYKWGYKWWAFPGRAAAAVVRDVRIRGYNEHPVLVDVVDQVSPTPLLIVCNEYDRAVGMPAERFRELYDRAREPKSFVILPGTGHIYDWPVTFQYLTLLRDWLRSALG